MSAYTGDDINECTGSNNCQQVCTNTEGSFTCGCEAGYVLDSEGATCSGIRILCLLCAFHLVMFSQESPALNLLSAVISLAMGCLSTPVAAQLHLLTMEQQLRINATMDIV